MADIRKLTPLEHTYTRLLARRHTRSLLRRLTTLPPNSVDFSSNDYLSLSTHPQLRAAFLSILQCPFPPPPRSRSPSPSSSSSSSSSSSLSVSSSSSTSRTSSSPSLLGSRGSRLLDGNTPLAAHLETLIPHHHRAPAGILFNSGFEANVGVFASLPQPGDVVIYDELIHASAHDGMRLSRVPPAHRRAFPHNSVRGLRRVLEDVVHGVEGVREGKVSVFVGVEAVYSMDGDVAPLREMLDLVEAMLPRGNGYVIVDEAHATGVFGELGRGLVCELGVEDRVFARVVTFGKALGAQGAIVLCTPTTRSYLINYARTLIYTTAPSHPSLALIKATYDLLLAGKTESLLTHLHALVRHTHTLLTALIAAMPAHAPILSLSPLPKTTNPSPIIPLFTPHPRSLATYCQARGYMVRAIVAPTVPRGAERVRVCLHAGNTFAEVEGLVKAVRGWAEGRVREEGEKRKEKESRSGGGQAVRAVMAKARL